MRLAILLAAMLCAWVAWADDMPEIIVDMSQFVTADIVSLTEPNFPDGKEVMIYFENEKVIKIWAAKAGEWRIEYVSTQDELNIPPGEE